MKRLILASKAAAFSLALAAPAMAQKLLRGADEP